MSKEKSYGELKRELDDILLQLDGELDDLDEALRLYEKGQKAVAQLEKYLKNTKAKIGTIKTKSIPKKG